MASKNDALSQHASSSCGDSTVWSPAKIYVHKVVRGWLGQKTMPCAFLPLALWGQLALQRGDEFGLGKQGIPLPSLPWFPQISIQLSACWLWLLCAARWYCSNRHTRACFVTVSHDWRQMLWVLKSVLRESLYCLMVCPTSSRKLFEDSSVLNIQDRISPIKGSKC